LQGSDTSLRRGEAQLYFDSRERNRHGQLPAATAA